MTMRAGIGQPLPRSEDQRLLTGRGRYVDDISSGREAFMAVVRAPHAAARITGIDIAEAEAFPGVLAVLTGADLVADGIGTLHTIVQRHKRDGSPMERPPFHPLAVEQVRFAGEGVAVVVAETMNAARDAADMVMVDYEPLDAVTSAETALEPGAPVVWPGLVEDNISFVFEAGDKNRADAAFAKADHVTTLDFRVTRVSANPLEPRNAIGSYDPIEERYTLVSGVQIPHKIRSEIAENTLGIDPMRLRIIAPDVGGAFGMKGSPFPEHVLVLWASRRLGRPVRWTATRSESFLSDFHARDNFTTVSLALDKAGRFLGLKVRTKANLGAYLGFNTPHSPTNNLGGLSGVYTTPAIHAEVLGVHTNTQPTAPYRGAGRPEATYAIERVIDLAAEELGMDRVELRRRNLIPASAMPYDTGFLFVYDTGEFERNMDAALDASDFAGFEARRKASQEKGLLRGISLVNAIEIAGGPFGATNEEGAEIRFDPGGGVTLLMGTQNHGQGHETAFRQMAVEFLGVAPENVRVVSGDTDAVRHGRGTFGSRSAMAGGLALRRASDKLLARARKLAAHLLETGEEEIDFDAGTFRVRGANRNIRIEEVARASYIRGRFPIDWEMGLGEQAIVIPPEANFPNGVHVCEVEVDPETGQVAIVNYAVVDDVGTVVNPLLVKGQIHGGVAQGIGQAVGEEIVFDDSTGQLLTGSFMDYQMPRATDLPMIGVISNPVPSTNNALGIKGAGEAGAVGALPAYMNAVIHALSPLGVRHLDMPATPCRVWQAIQEAREAKG
ncbi:xanthine dehydrogenase family protein molybdopterin-binding subunit [Alkalilacustris brevis]|uniref:xanthine dehydrogenase family protein molybdopterin-binding subunit n=1 Tax=Alkalilacustris brevis TaxID=2026338 RepID=UPI000E0CCFB6|nr:xanthine dehydrogenase family protein molybdopterin-binding subunit [Alkalilacustris brevis]